jgi:hypothetical protein
MWNCSGSSVDSDTFNPGQRERLATHPLLLLLLCVRASVPLAKKFGKGFFWYSTNRLLFEDGDMAKPTCAK